MQLYNLAESSCDLSRGLREWYCVTQSPNLYLQHENWLLKSGRDCWRSIKLDWSSYEYGWKPFRFWFWFLSGLQSPFGSRLKSLVSFDYRVERTRMPEPLPISGHSRFDRRCSSRVYVLVPQVLRVQFWDTLQVALCNPIWYSQVSQFGLRGVFEAHVTWQVELSWKPWKPFR